LAETQCRFTHAFATQGAHAVKLSVTTPAGETSSFDETVNIKDLFIVSIGDSYASGEGNPDKPRKLLKAGWIDSRCHRSATAGPALAALTIEQDDPHTSVTFISFACSGAGLKDGLTGEFKKGSVRLRPQLDQVADAVSGRTIDALLISIGGNDVNFGSLVLRAIRLPHAETDRTTAKIVTTGLAALAQRYADVAHRLSTMNIAKVFITEYPFIVRNENKQPCDHSPKFPDLLNGISRAEAEWAERDVIKPLNDKVKEAATLFGWVYVTNIASKFSGDDPELFAHGYCANGERWVNTFNDSWKIQGNQFGTAHPNSFGHAWYAKQLVLALRQNGVIP
jgi:lysophospholipase L1-like esterase